MLSKDIFNYLTLFVDIKTFLKFRLLNKYFSSNEFLVKNMRNKYPTLKIWESSDLRNFYLTNLSYIIKLDKKEFPFIPTEHFNPECFYKTYENNLWRAGLEMACYTKRKDLIDYMLNKTTKISDMAILNAVSSGDCDTVFKLYEKRGYNEKEKLMNLIIEVASANGHEDLINFSIYHGATDLQSAMEWAARNGELEIIKMLLTKTTVFNFEEIKSYAILGGHENVLEFLGNF